MRAGYWITRPCCGIVNDASKQLHLGGSRSSMLALAMEEAKLPLYCPQCLSLDQEAGLLCSRLQFQEGGSVWAEVPDPPEASPMPACSVSPISACCCRRVQGGAQPGGSQPAGGEHPALLPGSVARGVRPGHRGGGGALRPGAPAAGQAPDYGLDWPAHVWQLHADLAALAAAPLWMSTCQQRTCPALVNGPFPDPGLQRYSHVFTSG